jgi:capsular polysaccharide transport system permease protein
MSEAPQDSRADVLRPAAEVAGRASSGVVESRPSRPVGRLFRRLLPVRPVRDIDRPAPVEIYVEEPSKSRIPVGRMTFLAFVLVPSILVAIYLGFIATDQFVAETRFVVRLGPQDNASSGTGLAAVMSSLTSRGGSGGGTSAEDAHVVTSYIRSRAIVDEVSKLVDLRAIFTRPEADFYARLPFDATIDDLAAYWQRMVSTYVDGLSGIVTVEVRAFRPADAVVLVRAIVQLSEKLVNDISTRARSDALRRASEEVERAQQLLYEAISEMERYRNAEGLIDPVQTATETGKLLTKVLADQIAAEGELFVANRSLSADAPAVRRLTSQIQALRRQAADLRGQLAGNREEARNVAASLAKFEEVAIKQKMAETLYGLAEKGLDRARRTAEAQSVYLSVFVPPGLPEEYTYPKRAEYTLAIAAALFVFWSIAALIWLSVEDHRLS